MSDRRFQHTVGAWLHDEDPAPPDSSRSARAVAERLPSVRQQSRWWPLPLLRRTPVPPAVVPETDPVPFIPATNGQSPTVIGRTTSMLSPFKAITAGAIVFALGGAFLITQPLQQQGVVPGAEQDQAAPHPPEPFSAVVDCGGQIAFGSTESLEYPMDEATMTILARRGDAWRPIAREVSDPRFEGRYSISSDADSYYAPGLTADDVVGAGTWRIENDEGAWQGSFRYMDPLDGGDVTVTVLLTGEGTYEGLTAMVESAHDPVACVWQWRGLVVDGNLPDYPEPPAD